MNNHIKQWRTLGSVQLIVSNQKKITSCNLNHIFGMELYEITGGFNYEHLK